MLPSTCVSVYTTYIKFEEVLMLFRGNLIVRSEGQVMDFNALPQVHSLQNKFDIYLEQYVTQFSLFLSAAVCTKMILTVPDRMS